MELRDAVCKQFQSREILGHAESILNGYSSISIGMLLKRGTGSGERGTGNGSLGTSSQR